MNFQRTFNFIANHRASGFKYVMAQTTDDLIPTRTTLLHRLKDWQDQSSWQDFFDTYWKLIFGIAVKSGLSEAEAQDVVQETMISVAKHISTFKYDPAIGSFKSWLLNMTRWRIIDQLRRRDLLEQKYHPNETEIGTKTVDKIEDPINRQFEEEWDIRWEENLFQAAVAK